MIEDTRSALTLCLEGVSGGRPDVRELVLRSLSGSRRVAAGDNILRAGAPTSDIYLLIEGLAVRFKILPNGSRQILSFRVPGDFCECQALASAALDYDVAAITRSAYAVLPRGELLALIDRHPPLASAFLRELAADHAIEREGLLSLGRRKALSRMAHLFCEMRSRLKAAGLCRGEVVPFQVTQQDLADALGLSLVHVNRCLQQLHHDGFILLRHGAFEVCDLDGLSAVASYDGAYLSAGSGSDSRSHHHDDRSETGFEARDQTDGACLAQPVR